DRGRAPPAASTAALPLPRPCPAAACERLSHARIASRRLDRPRRPTSPLAAAAAPATAAILRRPGADGSTARWELRAGTPHDRWARARPTRYPRRREPCG